MKKYILSLLPIFIFFVIIFAAASYYIYVQVNEDIPEQPAPDQVTQAVEYATSTQYVKINGAKIVVDIADTESKRAQGLSGRKSLDPNAGMLFVFDSSYFWRIWMKDMNFPIDILWIDELNRVIHIEKNVSPSTYLKQQTFTSEDPALYVLEINAGKADAIGIKIGDMVENLSAVAK